MTIDRDRKKPLNLEPVALDSFFRLKPAERQILYLRAHHSVWEVSEILRIGLGEVEARQNQALDKLGL